VKASVNWKLVSEPWKKFALVPTLPRGNADGDAPASRFAEMDAHRLGTLRVPRR